MLECGNDVVQPFFPTFPQTPSIFIGKAGQISSMALTGLSACREVVDRGGAVMQTRRFATFGTRALAYATHRDLGFLLSK
jgi:hypothetical protein